MSETRLKGPRIIVAMDFDNARECLAIARRLSPDFCRLKVGKELFTACGPKIVEDLMGLGFDVFLDRSEISRHSHHDRQGRESDCKYGCMDGECPCVGRRAYDGSRAGNS